MIKLSVEHKVLTVQVVKTLILFVSAIYLITVPSYYWFIARPLGLVDFLLPYEAGLASLISGVLFAWYIVNLKRCYKILVRK